MSSSTIRRFTSISPLASLAWQGDDLIDLVGWGKRWLSDGTEIPASISYSYHFDRALVSSSGRYGVLFTERHTKGIILDGQRLVREIDRSFYHAAAYAYPVALGRLPDGREVIAHCPKDYNRIEIETLDKGRRLTPRRRKAQDIFHSRLSFSPDGRFLLSAGWKWHPFSGFCIFDVGRALADPSSLDREEAPFGVFESGAPDHEVHAACWLDSERVLMTTDTDYAVFAELDDRPGSGIWSVRDGDWLSRSNWNPQATLHAFAGGALYVENGHPHWWTPGMETPLSWPDITVIEAPGSAERRGIKHDCPLIAAHPTEPRFAAVTAEGIVVVELDRDENKRIGSLGTAA